MVRGRRVLRTTAPARAFRPERRGSAARWGTREAPVAACTVSEATAAALALAAARRAAPELAGAGPARRVAPQVVAAARPEVVAPRAVAPLREPAAPSRRRLGRW